MAETPESEALYAAPASSLAEEAAWPDVVETRAQLRQSIDEGVGDFIGQDEGVIPEEEEEEESLLALIGENEEIFQGDTMVFETAKLLGENYDDTRDNLNSRGITSDEIHSILASNPRFQEILTNRRRTKLQFVYGKIRSLKRILREIGLEVVSVKWGYETLYSLKKSSTATGEDRETTEELKAEIEALRAQVRRLTAARRVDTNDLRRARTEIANLKSRLGKVLEALEEATAQVRPRHDREKITKSCVDILLSNMSAFEDDDTFDVIKFLAEAADSNSILEYSIKDINEGLNDDDLDEKSIGKILATNALQKLNAKLSTFGLKIMKNGKKYSLIKIF